MNPRNAKKLIIVIGVVVVVIFASVAYYENYREQHSDNLIPVLISPFINNTTSPHQVGIQVSAKIYSKDLLTNFDFSNFWVYVLNGSNISVLKNNQNSSTFYSNISFSISRSNPSEVRYILGPLKQGYYYIIPEVLGGSYNGGVSMLWKFASNTTFKVTANGSISFISIPGISTPGVNE